MEKKMDVKMKSDITEPNGKSGMEKEKIETEADMPEPDTKNYDTGAEAKGATVNSGAAQQAAGVPKPKAEIKLKPEFKETLEKTIGTLGYNRELGIPERHIQVFQIFEIIKNVEDKYITDIQLNELLNIIALAPYNIIAGFMEKVRTAKGQAEFWTLKKK